MLHTVEMCVGAGGEALGLEQAGISHAVVTDNDAAACQTIRLNRPDWHVVETDLRQFNPGPWMGSELVTGGLPCPPWSVAGKQLGPADERDLFGYGMSVIDIVRPLGGMLENVRGMLDPKFEEVRNGIRNSLRKLGYSVDWRLLNASDFGVPQLRPRVVFVLLRHEFMEHFEWPQVSPHSAPTVGECLIDLMSANGWRGADAWAQAADDIAPTLVGGSKKHGGPDLGPTRARKAWAALGVNGKSLANEGDAPGPDFVGMPRLTVRMAARIQGFPDHWTFSGGKTAQYRQVGNAFPPPVARAVALQIKRAIEAGSRKRSPLARMTKRKVMSPNPLIG